MQLKNAIVLTSAIVLALAAGGCNKEVFVTTAINEDGTAKVTYILVGDRTFVEQLVTESESNWARMHRQKSGAAEPALPATPAPAPVPAAAAPPAPPPTPAAAPAAAPEGAKAPEKNAPAATSEQSVEDAKLAARIRRILDSGTVEMPRNFPALKNAKFKGESVDVTKDTVRTTVSLTFPDLKEFVEWSPGGPLDEGCRLEKDDAGKLRLEIVSGCDDLSMRMLRGMVESSGVKIHLKIVMPGKVLSSTLPQMEGNETSFSMDTAKAESLDEAERILKQKGVIVVAEPGKLVMDSLPLKSSTLTFKELPDETTKQDRTGKDVIPKAHENNVESVQFSPDGKLLASGSRDQTIKLWSMPEGKLQATLKGHTNPFLAVAFSPDGKLLASGDRQGCLLLWKLAEPGKRWALFDPALLETRPR